MTARQIEGQLGTVPSSGIIIDENGAERTINRTFADPAAIADNAIVAAQGAGIKIRVLAAAIYSSGTNTVRWKSAANSISGSRALVAQTHVEWPYNPHGWFQTNANEALNLAEAAAVAVAVEVVWIQAS